MVSTDITDPKVGIARNASSKFKPVNVDGVRYEKWRYEYDGRP